MLHIVAFDVPYPADYGGAIDVFYKIKALHAADVKITLHCFTYRDRQTNAILETFCDKVFYYKRKTSFLSHLSSLPYIVKSRNHSDLIKNLCADEAPILFEGMHTCFFIDDKRLLDRKKMVRMHNVEWQYYKHLADTETNFFKKLFFSLESTKLKKFEEKIFFLAKKIFCISKNDAKYFLENNFLKEKFQKYFLENNSGEIYSKNYFRENLPVQLLEKNYFSDKICFLPPFHAHTKVISKIGFGDYILYHGDLSVNDNVASALELIENVFSKINTPCIIAGKNPDKNLITEIALHENIQIVANPDSEKMLTLIENAQINVLHTRHTSGMKLKLLNALFVGRFCFVNTKMVEGTGLEKLCEIYDSFGELIFMIMEKWGTQWQQKNIEARKVILETDFSNEKNVKKILQELN